MAQLHDKHLTTEQLSAFFDQQLASEEQAAFDVHMSTCQQCQRSLADLRLTVALLRAMPEEEVPRSFVLPGALAPVPVRTIRQDTPITPVAKKQQARINTLRRSVRVLSALAAVLALLFIVSGLLSPLHFGANESATTAAPASSYGSANTPHTVVSTPNLQNTDGARHQEGAASTTPTPVTTQTPGPTGTATTKTSTATPTDQGPTVLPAIDFNQPVVRISLGVLLLALSIIVLIVTRRRQSTAN
ncbi:MAG TPA: zf-HC2 domain-containing protein [Ktedonobacteraceae bacterium]